MKLKVLGRYRSPRGRYEPGEVIDVPLELGRYLLSDAPGCFEPVVEEVLGTSPSTSLGTSFDEPPADKMIRQPRRKK